jgi:hypothetical protein
LSVVLQVLADLKRVLQEEAGLELNVSKTSVLPEDVTQQSVFDVAQNIIALTHLIGDVAFTCFCPPDFVGIGVSIGADAFMQNF